MNSTGYAEILNKYKDSIGLFDTISITDSEKSEFDYFMEAYEYAINVLSNSDRDCISRAKLKEYISKDESTDFFKGWNSAIDAIYTTAPSIQSKKVGHCKDCKFFEYDSVAKVDGVPLIVAHEICNKWGDGCKTSEDGFCFLFEPNCGTKMQGN